MGDMSANFGDNAQTSVHHLKMPPSPIASEVIEEVTETGFNVDNTEPTSPEIYFYMKSKFKSSKCALQIWLLFWAEKQALLLKLFSTKL